MREVTSALAPRPLEIAPVAEEPEPRVPADLRKALAAASSATKVMNGIAGGPLIVTFVLGGRPPQFQAFGMEERSRVGRLDEVVAITRALLAGERVTHRGATGESPGISS